jgi:hypothetical protein
MKNTLLTALAVLTLAALLSGCSLLQSTPSAAEEPRTLNVNGTGTVYVVPDIARVSIGVNTQNEDVAAALSENTRDANAILQALMNLGVAEDDIQTSNFYVYQQTNYKYNEPQINGESEQQTVFVVQNTVNVVVRNLDSLGEVLSAVVSEGANTINGISFDIEDPAAATAEAQQKAIDEAASQAQAIADAAGVELGEIAYISISDGYTRTADSAVVDQAAGGAVPIASGTLSIQVTANITYEFN